MAPPPERAVFLSYASQDADAARRICESLRAVGLEVWFDQNELTGGDVWDAKIRKQIKDCALFIPIISANTQARTEGYFRLEWRIADQRTHLMAKGRPFLLPVVIDATSDSEAHVPDSFTEVQWTRLPGGETNAAFCARVQKLLGGEMTQTPSSAERADAGKSSAPPRKKSPLRWLIPAVLGLALAIWQQWHSRTTNPPGASPAVISPAATASSAEIVRLRARIIPDRWQKGDFEAVSATLDRIIQADPENADAWALRSISHSLQVLRIIDPGTAPLEAGKAAAEHALRIAPDAPLPTLALGMHLVAMISRGGDPQACRGPIDRARAALPAEPLTRYAELVSFWLGYDFEHTEARAKAWIEAEPGVSYPAWILTSLSVTTRRPADVEKWAKLSAGDVDVTGMRALSNVTDLHYYLRADVAAARATMERVPARLRAFPRIVMWRWQLAMAEHQWDDALQELARVPDAFLFDIGYNGPKALLAGLAHQHAGRADAAAAQFREAERLLREQLARDSDNEVLRAGLALALASAGRKDEARNELALIEPLVKNRAPTVYRGRLVITIMQAQGAMGDYSKMAFWLRKTFAEPSGIPLTPASFRLDPRFNAAVNAPEIQALLKEFASLDQPAADIRTAK